MADPEGRAAEGHRRRGRDAATAAAVVTARGAADVASDSFGCRIVERNIVVEYNAQSYANQSHSAKCLTANHDAARDDEDVAEVQSDRLAGARIVNCGFTGNSDDDDESEDCSVPRARGARRRLAIKRKKARAVSGDCVDHDSARERQKQHRQTFKLSTCEQQQAARLEGDEDSERQQRDSSARTRDGILSAADGGRRRGGYLKSHLASVNQLNEEAISAKRSRDLSRRVVSSEPPTEATTRICPAAAAATATTRLTCSVGRRRSHSERESREKQTDNLAHRHAELLIGKSSIFLVERESLSDVNCDKRAADRRLTATSDRQTRRLEQVNERANDDEDDDERTATVGATHRQRSAGLEHQAAAANSKTKPQNHLPSTLCTIGESCAELLAPKSADAKLSAPAGQHSPSSSAPLEQQIDSNELSYLRFLSNLTKSITQRQHREPAVDKPTDTSSCARSGSGCAPAANQLDPCAGGQELAPEVIGYMTSRLKRRQQQLPSTFEIANESMTIEYIDDEGDQFRACKMTASSNVVEAVGASSRQHRRPAPADDDNQPPTTNNQRLVRLVAMQTDEPPQLEQPKQANQNELKQQQQQQTKLSIATTTTTTTTTRSSVSSLSSCILSDVTSESEVRLKWGKKMDFLLSIIGFAVDLANIWRFPYLVYKNGGGVFLIPYTIMLVFGGIPLFFLELCLGQFVKKGPITVWNKICPSMKGVGYCSILISWYVSFYYNVLIAWSVYFIYRSLLSIGDKMPWEDCDNSWNSRGTCVSISQLKILCAARNDTATLETCRRQLFDSVNVTSPASEFFVKELSQIDQSTGLDDMGYLRPELVACTMIVYLLHYFSLFRGLETSGKVVWVTATAPYIILSILLVRGLFLPGASMGIEYYLSPKLEKLADPQVWIDAAGQVFYSIGVGFGVHLTYASFNSHNNNCYRDCLMTSAVNAATSVYSGLVVFVYLGYMASNLGIEIDKVASEGYSLVFEVYPEALTTLPIARFWSILFFIMLLTLGIDSAMGGLEAVITGLEDEFKFAKRLSRGQLTGLVIFSSFLPALISCTQGGAYTLFWFDIYSAGVSLLFSALFETIGVVYCYGLDKFIVNIESMLGKRPHLFFILCWKYISPVFLVGVIFMSIYTASTPVYRGYTFPVWSIVLGWCLAFSSVAAMPIVALWTWCSGAPMLAGNKRPGGSPEKSPRKKTGPDGAISNRHLATKKQVDQQHYKTMTISCNNRDCRIGGVASGGNGGAGSLTTTTILESSPSDHHRYIGIVNPVQAPMGEEML